MLLQIHNQKCSTSQKSNCLFHFLLVGYGFNATFNKISVILWRSVLLVDETGIPGENH
jgi:hypothetical protein